MSKLAQATSKYTIYAKFEADGTVEKPDVIGAVFGQTEGLLGPDMDLRELQRTGRIGRIDVELNTVSGKTSGVIVIPSSLDSSETALIAATIETIERVGPCNAKLFIEKIEDVRILKRQYVVDRAKDLLGKIFDEGAQDTQEISEHLKEAIRSEEISDYQGLPAGPNLESYDSIVIVEGRADVLNLLRAGVKNVIAIEGTDVPQSIIGLSKEKVTIAFLDGDRGGDLILKELKAVCDIDFVARAPEGKEVEELTKKEIFKYLRDKEPGSHIKSTATKEIKTVKEEFKPRKYQYRIDNEKAEKFKSILEDLVGTRAAYLLNEELSILGKVPLKEMFNAIKELDAYAIIFDGGIDQNLVNLCSRSGVKYVVGMKSNRIRIPENVTIITQEDLA